MQSNKHKIGVLTATIVGMNAMIGSGIFTIPAALANYVGPAGIFTFMIVAASVWFIAQSLSRLAVLFPEEGSFYAYTKQWAGHTVGLLATFSYFVGLIVAMGLLSQMIGIYLQQYFPSLSSYSLGVITLAIIVFLNIIGITISQLGQIILIILTVTPILISTVLCFTKANIGYLTPFAPFGTTHIFMATRTVIFGFFGFEAAASLFNLLKNPEKNVPRALTYSITIVSIIYILFSAAIVLSIPLGLFTNPRIILTDLLKINFPNSAWIINLVHISVLAATIGTIHSMVWSSSNLLMSIIKKIKSIRIPLLEKNNRATTIIVGFLMFLTFRYLHNIDLFFGFTAAFIVLAYMLSMITLLTIKAEWKSRQNIKTIIGLIAGSVIFSFAVDGILTQIFK